MDGTKRFIGIVQCDRFVRRSGIFEIRIKAIRPMLGRKPHYGLQAQRSETEYGTMTLGSLHLTGNLSECLAGGVK